MLRFLRNVILAIAFWLAVPYAVGVLSYYTTFGGVVEQVWLGRAIGHLKALRARCNDRDLQGVLDYTIQRYNRIGPFDVAVTRIPQWRSGYVIGCNNPLVPGITLDIGVLTYPIHEGAMVLVHEALHDYWPCVGHAHVTPVMERIEKL